MDLKKPLFALFPLLMLIAFVFGSCNGKNEVVLASDSIVVEDAFKKSNGELCKIKTRVVISYPDEYKDNENAQNLKALFCTSVLNSPDGVNDIKAALQHYAKSIITQNSPLQVDSSSELAEEDYDEIDVDYFEISVNISNVYNDNDLLSFCCEKTVKKNDKETAVLHRYVNLDLVSMKKMTCNDLFLNGSDGQINQMLKNKLLEQEGVKTEDELNDLGYFNLQNLVVTDNFYFSDSGITWCYVPGVLSVPAVGETALLLPFEDLMRFKCEDSALNRI